MRIPVSARICTEDIRAVTGLREVIGLHEVTGQLTEHTCLRADWSAQGECRLRELTG